jgi:cell division protein FtsQ
MSEQWSWAGAPEPAFARTAPEPAARAPRVLLRGERSGRNVNPLWRLERKAPRGLGTALAVALILAAAGIGAVRGGQYQAFVAAEGSLSDFIAREVGLGVKVVTISGVARLDERQTLAIAGVSPKSSIPFFDVDAARARLEKTPLVASASVRKLYPNRLVIDVVERQPAALWQRDGEVSIVAADGAALDELKETQLNDLPFVVGKGANKRLRDYLALLDAAQELKAKIEAGVFVSERRWNLKMKTGVDVKLPETDPSSAMPALLKLERDNRILEKDIISLDLREPGRAFARLSADAADARAQKFADAKKKKGEKP